MKRMLFTVALLALTCASVAQAQQPLANNSLPELKVTGSTSDRVPASLQNVAPEVWVYMQERQRYDDPQQAVRRKAEQRALARTGRIEARRWYGLSNSRPTAAVTPMMDLYSPAWRGGGQHPFEWMDVQNVPQTATRGTISIRR